MENVNVIKTDQQYIFVLKEIEKYIDAPEESQEFERLELLTILVDNYENENHPLESPDPISTIEFLLVQRSLNRKDLIGVIGDKSRVSDVFNKKRKLSLSMIRKLTEFLKIPSDLLIKDYQLA